MPPSDRDDDELSDSARAALRIQQEIEGGVSDEAPRKTSSRSSGNGRTHGAVTGIALGEYADSPKASKGSKASKEGVQIRAKGSKVPFQTGLAGSRVQESQRASAQMSRAGWPLQGEPGVPGLPRGF